MACLLWPRVSVCVVESCFVLSALELRGGGPWSLCAGHNFGAGNANCLTAPREITYDAQRQKLLAMPIAELAKLRGQTLANLSSSVTISAGSSHAVFGTPLPSQPTAARSSRPYM